MALIRANCNECGDVELRSRDILVRTCLDTYVSEYNFKCPVCRMVEVKPANDQIVDILTAAGCRVESWSMPKELTERDNVSGPIITVDDIIDLHRILDADYNSIHELLSM